MRTNVVLIFILEIFISFSEQAAVYKPGSKEQYCFKNGTCIDVCLIDTELYDTDIEYLLPGQEENNDGLCQEFKCSEEFAFSYIGCGVSSNEWCSQFLPDYDLPYPECCVRKCATFTNADELEKPSFAVA